MKALSYMLYLFFLVGMSSCCFGPWYYQKSGQMHVKGFVPWFGKYEQTLDGADPATFHKIDNFHAVDANHVYVLSNGWYDREINILKDADPATFEVLSRHRYTRDAHHVWFDTKHETKLVLDADCKTIEVLDDRYARTDSLLFHDGVIVPGVDPKTVVIHKSYIEDKNDVYWRNLPLHVSDRESFTFVKKKHDTLDWAKDKNYVYCLWRNSKESNIVRSAIADYDSFEAIDMNYARDNVQVYYCDTILPGADPSSFIKIGYELYRDTKSVYYKGKRVCDYTASFKDFLYNYITDGCQVYYLGYKVAKVLEGADVSTFEILADEYAKDKNHVYLHGKIVEGADPKTFKPYEDNK